MRTAREQRAGGAHARSTHRDSLKLQDVAKRSAAPISARRAVMGGRARAERRSRSGASPPRRIVHVTPAAGHVVDRGGIEIPLHRRDLLGQSRALLLPGRALVVGADHLARISQDDRAGATGAAPTGCQ